MGAQFASFRGTNANATYSVSVGGTTTAATSLWYSICFANVAGFNQGSTLQQIAVPAGSQLEVQFPPTLLASGEVPERIYLLAAPSNSSTLRRVLAYTDTRNPDGTAVLSIASILLTSDADFALDQAVANPAALTALTSTLPGSRRLVTSTGFVYQKEVFSTETADNLTVIAANTGNWVRVGSFLGDVVDTSSVGGADQQLLTINPLDIIQDITYDFDGSLGRSVGYWYLNSTAAAIASGTQIGIQVILNQQAVSNLFKNKLRVRFVGFVDQSTGALDTTMPNAGVVFSWNPQNTLQMALTADLPVGSAAYYEIQLEADLDSFGGSIPAASELALSLYVRPLSSIEVPFAILTGDFVAQEGNARRVVPGNGLLANALSGRVIVNNLMSSLSGVTTVTGWVADLAGQLAVTDGSGSVFAELPSYVVSDIEAQRAVVGTVSGISAPRDLGSIVLGVAGGIQIAIAHPSDNDGLGTIRSDYPDLLLRGFGPSEGCLFNPQNLAIYLDDGTDIYSFLATPALAQTSQTVTLTTLGATTPALPTPATNFGLYAPIGGVLSSVAGTIPAGTYQVYLGYSYDGNQITSISHAAIDGNIQTYTDGFADLLALSQCYGCAEVDYQALRDKTDIPAWLVLTVIATGTSSGDQEIWGFNPDGTAADDNTTVLTLTAGLGNWVRLGGGSSGGGQSPIQFQNEGVNLGAAGDYANVNFIGAEVNASGAGDTVSVTVTDQSARVSSNDTTPGFLNGKLVAGSNITLTENNNGANETLTIASVGQANLQFEDEGASLGTSGTVTNVDFVGAGVTATRTGTEVTVTIPGSVSSGQEGIQFKEEGANLGASGTVDTVDFVGSGVTASRVGNVVTVSISASGSGSLSFIRQEATPADNPDAIWIKPSTAQWFFYDPLSDTWIEK